LDTHTGSHPKNNETNKALHWGIDEFSKNPDFGRPWAISVHCTGIKASYKSVPMTKRYVNVKLPVELDDEVDKILEKLLGYRSRAEFVAEAVRDKLILVKE